MKNTIRSISLLVIFSLILSACQQQSVRDENFSAYDSPLLGKKVSRIALRQLGTPYVYGGATPKGFDCSGLVKFTYGRLGINVPRTAFSQYQYAKPIRKRELQPGDLIFFSLKGDSVSHVGIYYQAQLFIHAPRTGRPVSIENLNSPYWQKRYVSAGRLNWL